MLPRDLIKRCARNFPDKIAYYCGARAPSWAEMDRRSDALGSALQALGLGKGDTVAIFAPEGLEIYEHFFACMKTGMIRVGVNPRYAEAEIRHVLEDSAVKLLFVDAELAGPVRSLLDEAAARGLVLVGLGTGHGLPLDYEALIAAEMGRAPAWPEIAADDTLFISYTSGTSGLPKGVMLSHDGLYHIVIHTVLGLAFSPDDVWYMPASAAWVVIAMNVLGLANGMAHVIPERQFEVQRFMRDIERFGVTVFLNVPTALRWVMRAYREGGYDFSSVRRVIFGSSPASADLIHEIHATWPDFEMMQTYGLTEGGWVTFMTARDYRQALAARPELLASVGRCGVHFEASIRDETGTELPRGSQGDLWLRGPTVMKGYLNLPKKTAEVLTPDGWLRCGDIASMDKDGYLFLHDRKDFLIITGAINVFPSTVEAVLDTHPGVEEVAVIGIPHPEWGEAVVAVVRARPGVEVSHEMLLQHCAGKLGKPEWPKHTIFMEEPLPRTASAKIRKTFLRHLILQNPANIPWMTPA